MGTGKDSAFSTMTIVLALMVLHRCVANADAAEPTTWTWTWCSQDGEKVIQVTGVKGENFYRIKFDDGKATRITEDEIDGGSGILPGSQTHYGEDGHSDGFTYHGRVFRPCD